jgi:hypothetical protein
MPLRLSTRNILRSKQPIDLVDLSPPTRPGSPSSSSQSSFDEPKRDRPWRSLIRRKFEYKHGSGSTTRRKTYRNRILMIIFILCILASITVGSATPFAYYIAGLQADFSRRTWYSLFIALIKRLSPKNPSNRLQSITKNWQDPSDSLSLLSSWPQDFSRDIIPIQCHSHND